VWSASSHPFLSGELRSLSLSFVPRPVHTPPQQTATNLYNMASSLRCSYLLAVVVAAVLFGVCSAQSQQYHPQPNVLTGLNHQAVGATSSSSSSYSPAHALPIIYIYFFIIIS